MPQLRRCIRNAISHTSCREVAVIFYCLSSSLSHLSLHIVTELGHVVFLHDNKECNWLQCIFRVLAASQTLCFSLSCFTYSLNFGMFFVHLYFCIFITVFTKFETLFSYCVALFCESLLSCFVNIHEL